MLRAIFGFILVLFIPGYALSWAFFPRKEELGFMERMAISFVLSIASVMLSVLFIDLVLGVDTTPENIVIAILTLTGLAACIWKLEVIYLKSNLKQRIDRALASEGGVITIDISNLKRKFRAGLRAIFEPEIQGELKSQGIGGRIADAFRLSGKQFFNKGGGKRKKKISGWEKELASVFKLNGKLESISTSSRHKRKIDDFIYNLANLYTLNSKQLGNLAKLMQISKAFHEDARIRFKEYRLTDKMIVLESGHQPNFLPHSGVWKKVFLLDFIKRKLIEDGENAIALFGFADQNLSTASLLYANHIPALNKNGSEKIGFKLKESDEWKCFNCIEKPSIESWREEMSRVEQFYIENARKLNVDSSEIKERLNKISELMWKSYDLGRNFADVNAYFISKVCTEVFDLDVLFFRYSDVQRERIFVDEWRKIILNLNVYNNVYNEVIFEKKLDIAQVQLDHFPFWYHCDCGGKVDLSMVNSHCSGTCPVCEREYILKFDIEFRDLDKYFDRMSLSAVARNIIFSEGLGTALFISGAGGGLRYGLISNELARKLKFHLPVTLAWISRDYYLGLSHRGALQELMHTFELKIEDVLNSKLNEKINSYRDVLHRKIEELEGKEEKKVIQKYRGRYINSATQVNIVKKTFSVVPSMLDLFVNIDSKAILESWGNAVENAEVEVEERMYKLKGDVLYASSPFGISREDIPRVYRNIEVIEVKS